MLCSIELTFISSLVLAMQNLSHCHEYPSMSSFSSFHLSVSLGNDASGKPSMRCLVLSGGKFNDQIIKSHHKYSRLFLVSHLSHLETLSTWFRSPWKSVPGVATDPALAPVVVVLHTKTSAVEGVVVLVLREIKCLYSFLWENVCLEYLWRWKANSPHGSSRWRFHHTSMLWTGRQIEEEER